MTENEGILLEIITYLSTRLAEEMDKTPGIG